MAEIEIVLEGGPLDGERHKIPGDPARPPLTFAFMAVPKSIGEDFGPHHYYFSTPVLRPWLDQTWSWVYKYEA